MLCRMTGKSQLSSRVNLQTMWCCQSERHSRHCASRCHIARRPSLDRRRGRVVLCSSAEGDPQSSGPDEATKLLDALQRQQTIGSEYGEGFMQYRVSGESMHLDVDTLNEKLKLRGAERLRTAMRPDEAFGMIFCLEGVILDMQQVQQAAWTKVAEREGLPPPDSDRNVFNMRPERAITDVLRWTQDWKTAQRLSFELAHAVAAEFAELREPLPGVHDWLLALQSVKIPCAIVTGLDRISLNAALGRMGLSHHFIATVTAEDGMDTTSQQFLSAAIKLGRPPKDCVVFESSPLGIAAAHNCSCKAVAVQGLRPGYQLGQADLRCSSLSELSIYNIRRLFANRGADFMDLKKAVVSKQGSSGNKWKRRTASGTID